MKRLRLGLLGLLAASFLAVQAWGGAWTANEFIYKPVIGARGEQEKGLFDSGLDRIDARLGREYWLGDPKVGSTLQAAITYLGSTAAILHYNTSQTLAADLTVPANITLAPERGALIGGTKFLTLNGGFLAGTWKCFNFTGAGKVVFGAQNAPELNMAWWGEDFAALQAMVTCAVNAGGLECFVPYETVVFTDTLQVGPHPTLYANLFLRGVGGRYNSGHGTIFDATAFGDRPAIALNGIRQVEFKNLEIVGKNTAPNTACSWPTVDPVKANWVSAGCSDTQHSPYAGIAIDPYAGSAPGDPYPNPPGGSYGVLGGSSFPKLSNVKIRNFVAGFLIQPNEDNAGDAISLYDCTISRNTYAFSSGGGQNRSLHLHNTVVEFFWTGFTTLRHGAREGNIPSVFGGVAQQGWKLAELGTAQNAKVFNGLHVEAVAWLGELGDADSSMKAPTVFSGCHLGSGLVASSVPPMLFTTYGMVRFQGCYLGAAGPVLNVWTGEPGLAAFDSVSFGQMSSSKYTYLSNKQYKAGAMNLADCQTDGGSGDGYIRFDRHLHFGPIDGLPARQLIGHHTVSVWVGGTAYRVDRLNADGRTDQVPSDTFALSDGNNKGSVLTFHTGYPEKLVVGDILTWRVKDFLNPSWYSTLLPVFQVTAKDGENITAVALFYGFDATYASGLDRVYVMTPFHINAVESTCTTVNGNDTISAVTDIDNWKVGDWIRGVGIPTDVRILAINSGAGTMQLSHTCTADGSGVAIYNCRLTAM